LTRLSRRHLRLALSIAEYHKREAEVARIGRQLALATNNDPESTATEKIDAKKQLADAEVIKERLWKGIEKNIATKPTSEDEEYDWLVAAWYR